MIWDVFCRVIDNYGDAGVCWRLARELAATHGLGVRLWIDEPAVLARLWPGVDAGAESQTVAGVEVRHWREGALGAEPGEVVVEAFACELPDDFVAAMAARVKKPVWINLEYLSSEPWVVSHHGLASPHPRLPLTKYFYFPGCAAGSGGLLREAALEGERRAFLADGAARATFWRGLSLMPPAPGTFVVSLFAYENPAIAGLLSTWAGGGEPMLCLVPEGRALADVAAFFGETVPSAGKSFRRGNLEVKILSFTDQKAYDRLLWSCDCNFVRGEDSFVRAQWAERPFVWHIYPQAEDAHWPKLEAFLDLYCHGLEASVAQAMRDLWRAWNAGSGADAAWPAFRVAQDALLERAGDWREEQARVGELAAGLVQFCSDRL